MQIAYHIGANCTDNERLLRSVLRNVSPLLAQGVVVPGPGRYRRLLRETIEALDGAPPKAGARDILIDAIVEEDSVRRLVMSNDNFITIPRRIFDHGILYPQTEMKVRGMTRLFPQDDLSFFLGIRHPAAFLQEVARRSEVRHLRDFLGLMSPLDLRWSDVVARVRKVAPKAHVVVWCNEDTPLIWEDLIRLLSGIDSATPVAGGFDMIAQAITKKGLSELETMFAQAPPADRIERHEILAGILEQHALPEVMDDEVIYPELSEDLIAAMGEVYDEDVALLNQMDGVELVLPFR